MSTNKILFIIILILSLSIGCSVSREAYISAHPELNPTMKEAILKGEVLEGMTEDEVRASWGRPNQIVKGTEGDFYYVYSKAGGKGGTHSHDVVIFDKSGKVISSGPR
ncbi:MAG: outer membrane protein assembly factor BamE [Syntrophobacterales bacterium]|jgi:outer membrane protein assembly factor BamE (lipoprotein component of BamABCDE complex)|nr:outer membrane protein assembly factor BamE [Syntrophobacterales bacterium]